MRTFYKTILPDNVFDARDFNSWENYALPLGNGHFGACVFPNPNKERIQITENTLANPYFSTKDNKNAGIQSFGDIYLDFPIENFSNYERELDLDNAKSVISFESNNVLYKRETFTSYPDNVLVSRITSNSSNKIYLKIRFDMPFIGVFCPREDLELPRTGFISYGNDFIKITGNLEYYDIDYVGYLKVEAKNGKLTNKETYLEVEAADEVVIYFSCKTNYKLNKDIFLEQDPKKKIKKDKNLIDDLISRVINKSSLGYEKLYKNHLNDYQNLFNRVELSIEKDPNIPTDVLLKEYKEGKRSLYLETLIFYYGRYLLICSSRKGCLPSNLQGIWSAYESSPWSAGYWHNINIQMNYWPSNPSNLSELFLSYSDYSKAYMEKCRENADKYVEELFPEKYEKNKNGWTLGTGGWPFTIDGMATKTHSGPGTGAFTSLLFWDYYAFTQDDNYLKELTYPYLYEMSIFLEKCLVKIDDKYLVKYSASPENVENVKIWDSYHRTIGCAFDQQMVYENFARTIDAATILNIKDPFIEKLKEILPNLDPVLIGNSGQIKEYREENNYADIGEPHHRHISQLVGLYPGTHINGNNPIWLKAAEWTLNARGDKSTGWATAHRLLAWSRIKNSSRATDLMNNFVKNNMLENLWDSHPPFQIDGNFGYTAAICEMLEQSNASYIELLPCLPLSWDNGYFKGLKARGNFVIDCEFTNRTVKYAKITSLSGKVCKILNKNYSIKLNNKEIECDEEVISIATNKNDIIEITTK